MSIYKKKKKSFMFILYEYRINYNAFDGLKMYEKKSSGKGVSDASDFAALRRERLCSVRYTEV